MRERIIKFDPEGADVHRTEPGCTLELGNGAVRIAEITEQAGMLVQSANRVWVQGERLLRHRNRLFQLATRCRDGRGDAPENLRIIAAERERSPGNLNRLNCPGIRRLSSELSRTCPIIFRHQRVRDCELGIELDRLLQQFDRGF